MKRILYIDNNQEFTQNKNQSLEERRRRRRRRQPTSLEWRFVFVIEVQKLELHGDCAEPRRDDENEELSSLAVTTHEGHGSDVVVIDVLAKEDRARRHSPYQVHCAKLLDAEAIPLGPGTAQHWFGEGQTQKREFATSLAAENAHIAEDEKSLVASSLLMLWRRTLAPRWPWTMSRP